MPIARARMAEWLTRPPSSVAMAATPVLARPTVMLGVRSRAMRMAPCSYGPADSVVLRVNSSSILSRRSRMSAARRLVSSLPVCSNISM